MTVTINEAALHILLQTPRGAVQQEVLRVAEEAADALQSRINGIIDNPIVRPNADVALTPQGAVVGIVSSGRVSQYMDQKLGVRENWWLEVGEAAVRGS